jgi:hypothetical protein
MQTAYATALTETTAEDHGYPLAHVGGVALIDLRARFPLARSYGTYDAGDVFGLAQHHDAAFYPDDPLVGDDFDAELARLQTVYDIHRANGWGGIGYHTYGFPSGRLYLTRDLTQWGAHVHRRNDTLTGHCSAGRWSDAPPPLGTQLTAALAWFVHQTAHPTRFLFMAGHRQWAIASSPTECPGDAHGLWIPRLPAAITAIARARH